jgi:hypothetical protein
MAELNYTLTDDGIQYATAEGITIRIKGEKPSWVKVSMVRHAENGAAEIVGTLAGPMDAEWFRNKLLDSARERFGDVNGLGQDLNMISAVLDDHLKERRAAAAEHDQETNVPELIGSPYRVVNGGFVRIKPTQAGEMPELLTNFVARATEELVLDDGADRQRHYRLTGQAGDVTLPTIDVSASEFGKMNWVGEKWGMKARIYAGPLVRDHVRSAIEHMSADAPVRLTYQHTGWRVLDDGQRVYLSGTGAVDREGVEVELDRELSRYRLPADATAEEVRTGILNGLEFLRVAPLRVTVPLLGSMYLAPLSEVLTPDFVPWLHGRTGSLKSTLAALALNHYGDFTEDSLPLSFESTANSLERWMFLCKDAPVVVDDWRPPVSRGDASEMDRKGQRLLRAVGNRQGRGRMNSDSTLRQTYAPRGLVIATAEMIPEGPAFESAVQRALTIQLSREQVDVDRLSRLQARRKTLSAAMLGYIRHTKQHEPNVTSTYEGMRARFGEAFPGSHLRLPAALAALGTGLWAFLEFAEHAGVLDEASATAQLQRGVNALIEAGKAHVEATKGADPASKFLQLLGTLVAGRNVHFRDKQTGDVPGGDIETADSLGWKSGFSGLEPVGKFVGWVDEQFFYLDKDAAYAAVQEFANRGDIPFGIKPRQLWEGLAKAGRSVADEGRHDTQVRIAGKRPRVVQIPRVHVEGREA